MKPLALLMILTALAGCGANGAPFVPKATAGVSVGPDGVKPQAGVVTTNGTFTLGVNL